MSELNRSALRRLYNIGNRGKGTEGKVTRYDLHVTITIITYLALTYVVPVGKGGFGSPVVELALRLFLASLGNFEIDVVAEEIAVAALQSRDTVVQNLRAMASAIEAYTPPS